MKQSRTERFRILANGFQNETVQNGEVPDPGKRVPERNSPEQRGDGSCLNEALGGRARGARIKSWVGV
jgi:hypothetical protein